MKPVGNIPLPNWLHSPTTQALLTCIPNASETIRFVGGCVRNTLLNLPVKDIDLATTYLPQDILKFVKDKGFKAVPIGLEHGSMLVIVDSQIFEITTLRKDLETFGRHARVAFTDDWLEDAKRRDFTINSFYLSTGGELYDPWNGLQDLQQKVIKFIGKPEERVQEDYLRILRFFRFLAYFGNENLDLPSYDACKKFSSFLKYLPIERIQKELFILCSSPDPVFAIQKMYEAQIFDPLFKATLSFNKILLERLIYFETKYLNSIILNPLRRMYMINIVLGLLPLGAQNPFKLSKEEQNYIKTLEMLLDQQSTSDAILLYRYPIHIVVDSRLIDAALNNNSLKLDHLIKYLKTWKKPTFPLQGKDLLHLGIPEGIQIGQYLHEIEDWWINNSFLPNHADCLHEINRRLNESFSNIS
ncbi:MAG: hypothetical protein BGO77_05030 [Caedibacter sp. 37-49]|nr:MAG: hypothetical protein BGO77_05030 [Caedibacter sp. 37-49]